MSMVETQEEAPQGEGDRVEVPDKPLFENLYDITPDKRDEVLDKMNKQYSAARDFMSTLYPRMIANYKAYRSIAEPMRDELNREVTGRANLYVPYPWAIVETELPRLAGRLPRIRAFPRREAQRAKVEVIQDNLYYSFDRMNFVHKQILWMRQHAIYGFSPMYFFWRSESKRVLERVRDEATGLFKLARPTKVVWDDFDCNVLDVWDCFMQPGVEDLETSDWFFFREWLSMRDIEARIDNGVFYPEVKEEMKSHAGSNYQNLDEGRRDRDQLATIQRGLSEHSYGKHEVVYRLEDDRITVMIDRKVLARFGDNPNPLQVKPVLNVNLMPVNSEPLGISTIDQLAGLPTKLNMLSNARLDNIALLINRVFLAKRYSQTDFNNLVFSPANVILTDDLDSIKVLDVPDIHASSAHEIVATKEEIQFVSAVSDFLVGVKSSARLSDTATGVSTIVREANARFAIKLATFESGPLRRLIEACHAYNMVYQPEEKMIHVHGPEGYRMFNVNIEDILVDAEFAVEPGSSAPLDQLSRRDYLIQLLDRAQRAPQTVDQYKLWREVFEAGDFRNAEDMLLPKPTEMTTAEDAELIAAENMALLQSQTIELLGDDAMHIRGHLELVQSDAFQRSTEQVKTAVMSHLQAHVQKFTAAMGQAGLGGMNGNPAAAGAIPGSPGTGGASPVVNAAPAALAGPFGSAGTQPQI